MDVVSHKLTKLLAKLATNSPLTASPHEATTMFEVTKDRLLNVHLPVADHT
jgi:hypothetical protein